MAGRRRNGYHRRFLSRVRRDLSRYGASHQYNRVSGSRSQTDTGNSNQPEQLPLSLLAVESNQITPGTSAATEKTNARYVISYANDRNDAKSWGENHQRDCGV